MGWEGRTELWLQCKMKLKRNREGVDKQGRGDVGETNLEEMRGEAAVGM